MNSLASSLKLHSIDLRPPITVPLAGGLAIRLYGDCRPSCMETSALQKGLVLMLDGRELIEEGMGFGVPIVMYADKTFFSSKADVSIQEAGSGYTLTKVFTLDTVSLKKFGQVHLHRRQLVFSVQKNLPNTVPQTQKTQPSLQQTHGTPRNGKYQN